MLKNFYFLDRLVSIPNLLPSRSRKRALLAGYLEPTNEAYAIAKIAGIKLCQAHHTQHGRRFISIMPTNLYGIGDNYHPENSHVLPALLRRFHEAKENNADEVAIWGTGTPLREFMFADDLGAACLFLMEHYDEPDIINVGTGEEITILDLAKLIADVVKFKGKIAFDSTKPDGAPRKLIDSSRLHSLGFYHQTSLKEGLRVTFRDFLKRIRACNTGGVTNCRFARARDKPAASLFLNPLRSIFQFSSPSVQVMLM